MRGLMFVMSALAVIALAFWAYQENYRTQQAVKEVRSLHAQIGAAHARRAMLRAEWAYLNRPDRLRDLADLNFDRLGLLPFMPEAFGSVDQMAYPPEPESEFEIPSLSPLELSSMGIIGEEPL